MPPPLSGGCHAATAGDCYQGGGHQHLPTSHGPALGSAFDQARLPCVWAGGLPPMHGAGMRRRAALAKSIPASAAPSSGKCGAWVELVFPPPCGPCGHKPRPPRRDRAESKPTSSAPSASTKRAAPDSPKPDEEAEQPARVELCPPVTLEPEKAQDASEVARVLDVALAGQLVHSKPLERSRPRALAGRMGWPTNSVVWSADTARANGVPQQSTTTQNSNLRPFISSAVPVAN